MADFLIQALLGQQQQRRQENPFLQGAATLGQQSLAPQDAPWKDKFFMNLAQSVATGLLSGIGERRDKQENLDRSQRLQNYLQSDNPAQALASDPEFAEVAPIYSVEQAQRQADLKDKQAQYQLLYGQRTPQVTDPVVQQALTKAKAKQPLTTDELAALSQQPLNIQKLFQDIQRENRIAEQQGESLDLRKQQAEGVQDRFEKNFEFKEGERGLPGYVNVGGAIPNSTTIKELRTKIQGTEQAKLALQALKESGDRAGFLTLVGQDAALQAALQGALTNAGRVATNSGANFTKTEQGFITAGLPKTLAGDPIGAISALLLQRDQREFADVMSKFIDIDKDVQLFSQGFKNNNRPLDFYPADLVKQFGLQAQAGPALGQSPTANLLTPLSPDQSRLSDMANNPASIPAGMKLQRNPRTGEYRLVPQ